MVFKQIFRYHEYEYNYLINPKFIFDLVANTGLSCLYFYKLYPEAKIIALEPELGDFNILAQNTQGFNTIHAVNKAIWHKTGYVEAKNIGLGEWGFIVEESETKTSNTIESWSMNKLIN